MQMVTLTSTLPTMVIPIAFTSPIKIAVTLVSILKMSAKAQAPMTRAVGWVLRREIMIITAVLTFLVTNWDTELNALYQNELDLSDELSFRYSTFRIGISGLGNNITGWGTAWADFDNDSDEDLLVVNGHVPVTDFEQDSQLVRLYGNLFAEENPGQFRDWTSLVGLGQTDLGPLMARGSAVADFDNDGDLDIAINQISGPVILLKNQSQPQNWLGAIVPEVQPGTIVTLTFANGTTLTREARHRLQLPSLRGPPLPFWIRQ